MVSVYVIIIWLVTLWIAEPALTTKEKDSSSLHAETNYPRISGANADSDEDGVSNGTRLPNIVMIVLDDLGSHDLGLHGTGIHTPNIDGFVTGKDADGIYLDEYYVLPYCSPTRAALLSGMYPLRLGVHQVIREKSTAGLPLNVETLPEMLKRAVTQRSTGPVLEDKAGHGSTPPEKDKVFSSVAQPYRTHAVGKWHVGHSSWEQTPTFRGFDSFFGFYMGGQDYFKHSSLGGVDLHRDKSPRCGEGCSEVVDERGNYSTHVFTREAIEVVRNHAKDAGDSDGSDSAVTPLFLYLAYQAVHCPNEVPPEYIAPYENRTDWTKRRKNYAGMLTAADEGIGNLTQVLRETGMWENTLVILTTDNGGPTTVGCPQGSSNYPKRGGKCSLWEGGTTGDALLAGPALRNLLSRSEPSLGRFTQTAGADAKETIAKHRQSPHRFEHLFHVVDWFPTLAEWMGVVPSNQSMLDGVSQVEALAGIGGGGPARTELFGGYSFMPWNDNSHSWYGPSIRHLNWKLVQGKSGGPDANHPHPPGSEDILPPGDDGTSPNGNATDVATKYLLFDLERDPREENDLSEAYPDILQNMIYKLKLYRKSFVYPQINDDSMCPFPGLINTTTVGPAWVPWCKDLQESTYAFQ